MKSREQLKLPFELAFPKKLLFDQSIELTITIESIIIGHNEG